MRIVLRFSKNIMTIPLIILLMTACMKWLIEGVFDMAIFEVVLLSVSIFYILVKKGLRIKTIALPWILFVVNIIFSLAIHVSGFNLWGRGLVTVLIVAHVLFIDSPVLDYQNIMKFLVGLGIVNGVLVVIHFLLGSTFNDVYFRILNPSALDTAKLYYDSGYYFGLLYNPHEPAGLMAFAIGALLIWKLVSKSKKWIFYIGAVVLVIPLLLTGKKAVLMCAVMAVTLTILILYGSRKQWIKAVGFLILLVLFIGIFIVLAATHPEIAIFNRFNAYINQFLGGDTYDSGRIYIYKAALSEWQENKLFGIGWRNFNALSTTKYGMSNSHEVNCDYLQWLCETGIVGFLMSIIPVAIMLRRAVYVGRKMTRRFKSHNEQWIVLFAVFIQIFTLIYAFVEIPFFDIVFFSVYILSCIVINSAFVRRMQYI